MFSYRLHSPDGDDLGEATYAKMIKRGEEINELALDYPNADLVAPAAKEQPDRTHRP